MTNSHDYCNKYHSMTAKMHTTNDVKQTRNHCNNDSRKALKHIWWLDITDNKKGQKSEVGVE